MFLIWGVRFTPKGEIVKHFLLYFFDNILLWLPTTVINIFFSPSLFLSANKLTLWNGFISSYSAAPHPSRWAGYSAGHQACSISTCQRVIIGKSLSTQRQRNPENRGFLCKKPSFRSEKGSQLWQDRHSKVRMEIIFEMLSFKVIPLNKSGNICYLKLSKLFLNANNIKQMQ